MNKPCPVTSRQCNRGCRGFQCRLRGHGIRAHTKHTSDWDQRSLGVIEAAALAMAWASPTGRFVTRNSDEDSEP